VDEVKISCCFLYAICKYGYPPTIEQTLKVIGEMANMGFSYIELEGVGEKNLREVWEKRHRLKERCQQVGVRVVNFCPILPGIHSLDRAEREKNLRLFDLALEIAKFFNCITIQTDSFLPPLKFIGEAPYQEMINFGQVYRVEVDPNFNWGKLWEIVVDSYRYCAEKAAEAGLKFCLEPRVGEIISNTDALLRLIDAVGHENLGAAFDTAHQHAQKEILPLSVEKLDGRIFYVHVADNDGCVNEHLALGRGTIDWQGVFTALKKHHFDGAVAVDVGHVPDLEEQYIASRLYLERLAGRLGMQMKERG
jgi:sugar phosphate isomerase/epimerase